MINSLKKPNSDRTTPIRKNSAFKPVLWGPKAEKFRFLSARFALFLCCYCFIYIKYLISSSSKNRTRHFNINVNTGRNRKNSDFPLLEQRGIVPERQRHPGAGSEGIYSRTARLLSINPKETRLLLYSASGTRARLKKLKTSLPLIRFLRSLDALVVLRKGAARTSPNANAFRARAVRGFNLTQKKEMFI